MTSREDTIDHGTYRGYQQELRRRINTCAECRAAANAYQKQHRRKCPDPYKRTKRAIAARHRALVRLAELHPREMTLLLNDERRKAGLQ